MSSESIASAAPRPRLASLSCTACGAGIALHAQGWAVSVVCASCGSVLDATDPQLRVLQRHREAVQDTPQLPLGTRGTWHGAPWEVIGFQVVTITVDDFDYSWREYVVFNPYRGFLYLSEYQGHWNVIEKLRRQPEVDSNADRPTAVLDGRVFKHFQTATARTTSALGEFPWELRVGDSVSARDFVAPPYILSAEASDGEITWSLGTYTPAEVIAKAFGVSGTMRSPAGVFANQPNPHSAGAGVVGRRLGLFVLILVTMLFANLLLSRGQEAYSQRYTFAHGTEDSAAFVTPAFVLEGRPSSVTVGLDTDLSNDWVFYTLTLIEESTGVAREGSTQVSYYHGSDSDGSWSEGSRRESLRFASVPSGRYFLRVAPEGGEPGHSAVHYTVRVRRDEPALLLYLFALIALGLPALLPWLQDRTFETQRWVESDYAVRVESTDDEDDE